MVLWKTRIIPIQGGFYAFLSHSGKYDNDDIIFELTDDKGFAEKAMIECDKYHPKVIDFLSKDISLKTLTDMHFIPFSLTYNTYIINEIPKMLENDKNCFDEDVPELFT